MSMIPENCNKCGASISWDGSSNEISCEYCGQKLYLDFDRFGNLKGTAKYPQKGVVRKRKRSINKSQKSNPVRQFILFQAKNSPGQLKPNASLSLGKISFRLSLLSLISFGFSLLSYDLNKGYWSEFLADTSFFLFLLAFIMSFGGIISGLLAIVPIKLPKNSKFKLAGIKEEPIYPIIGIILSISIFILLYRPFMYGDSFVNHYHFY